MSVHECVSFILTKDNTVLLEKRSFEKASDPGLIAIPGGHIEVGENQKQALFRELKEELNIIPISFSYLCSLHHITNTEKQLIHYYVVPQWQGVIQALEADEVFWSDISVAPIDVMADTIALNEYTRIYSYL